LGLEVSGMSLPDRDLELTIDTFWADTDTRARTNTKHTTDLIIATQMAHATPMTQAVLLPMMWIVALLCVCVSASSYQAALLNIPSDESLRPSLSDYSVNDAKLKAINMFTQAVQLAKSQSAQVLVFPEFGTTTWFPYDVTDSGTTRQLILDFADELPSTTLLQYDCSSDSVPDFFSAMSCAAKENSLLLSFNMFSKVLCANTTGCPADGYFLYNSEILFDEQGNIGAVYHKQHPWLSSLLDHPQETMHITYNASFGVEFGIFICYDIVFSDPAVTLVSNGIKQFLYSASVLGIGKDLLIIPWSWLHGATVVSANLGSGVSVISVQGKSAPLSTFPLSSFGSISVGSVPM
jgi:predicted amidohydrolase